jgi:hypothetical protein
VVSLYRILQWLLSSWPIGPFVQMVAAYIFLDGLKIQIVMQGPLMGSKRTHNIAFNQSLKL